MVFCPKRLAARGPVLGTRVRHVTTEAPPVVRVTQTEAALR
jgi:hypothetical protein